MDNYPTSRILDYEDATDDQQEVLRNEAKVGNTVAIVGENWYYTSIRENRERTD